MKLPTFLDVEGSVGGRPKVKALKVRLSFYVSPVEADRLRSLAEHKGLSVSILARQITNEYIASLVE